MSIYPCTDTELCHQCFSLPCNCVPINIVMKEGKSKLKHLKNLLKENEICTIKYIDAIYHNDESLIRCIQTGHPTNQNNFQIVGREGHNLARNIKESIYIRVNNPSLNNNIGKFNLSHIWVVYYLILKV